MPQQQLKTLLIEDTDAHAELVSRHLARARERPVTLERVSTLEAGLRRLGEVEFDVVLLDLGLPDSQPAQTLARVLAQYPDMPVIVLTADDDLDLAVSAVQKGAQDHLVKSLISTEILVRSIRYAVERKRAEQALRASERLYRLLGETIDYGVWTCDAKGRNTYASPAFLGLVGLTQEQCSDLGWGEALHPDDRERTLAAWRACVANGGTWDMEHRFRGVDGKWHPTLARGTPIRDDKGTVVGWAGINLDIGSLKQAQQQLRELNETLEQRIAERTAFAEQRSDQLRRLTLELTQVERRERRRLAQLLHDDLQQLLVAAKMQAEFISNQVGDSEAQRSVQLLSKWLQESIESSRNITVELSPPIFFDAGLVAGLDWIARHEKEKYGLDVSVEIQTELEPSDEKIRVLLFEAVRELLFNIVKHAGVKVASVTVSAEGSNLKIVVADRGKGSPNPAAGPGSSSGGFGLFSLRERLELLGGDLSFESAADRGTRVTLLVPGTVQVFGPDADAPPYAYSMDSDSLTETVKPGQPQSRLRVLIADDHGLVRDGIANLLGLHKDIEVVGSVSNGLDAVDLARRLRPHVVLMDVGMPIINGIEATRRITAELPGVTVIGLSMHQEEDMANAMYQAGATAYLTKDGLAEELVQAIRKAHAINPGTPI